MGLEDGVLIASELSRLGYIVNTGYMVMTDLIRLLDEVIAESNQPDDPTMIIQEAQARFKMIDAAPAIRDRIKELEQALEETWGALNDLSFECDGVVEVNRPSRETYNRTFEIMVKHKEKAKALKGNE